MATPRFSPLVENEVHCFHCGDLCPAEPIVEDEHAFCCDGCRLVYDLLKDNNLCNYYDLSKAPGASAVDKSKQAAYASLDDPEVRAKLVRFENGSLSRVLFSVPHMHCSSCIWLLENLHKLNPGIVSSTVNFPRKEVSVDFETAKIKLSEVASLMAATGYAPAISLGDLELREKKKTVNGRVMRIGVAGFCFGNIMLLSFPEYLSLGDLEELPHLKTFFGALSILLSIPVLLYSASGFFVSAWKAIRFRSLNIDAPIALAIAVTFGRSLYEIISGTGSGFLDSMSGVVFFMLLGRYFQDRTYESITFDRDYRSYFPIAVTALRGTKEEIVPVSKLSPGDRIIIRNGELVPADAILRSEKASIDYSFVSGEAEPVEKKKGETIFAGARQTMGAIELEVTKATSQSYLTQLWNKDAGSQRRESEQKTYIDTINRWFSAAVLIVAFGTGLAWLFVDPSRSLNAITAVLIVVCPCTLLLAATFTEGSVLRWLGRGKFYLKNSGIIERLANADTIVFDKTGTITTAASSVRYEGEPLSEKEREAAAALAYQSGHPLSRRIANSLAKTAPAVKVTGVQEIAGKGIRATIGADEYQLGSRAFAGAALSANEATGAWLAVNGRVRGKFIIQSVYRDSLPEVMAGLKKNYRIELLSGDNDAEKESLRPLFGENMFFGQLPHEKLEHIRALQQEGKKVVMVGDGLNDAGALMQADAGIAVSDNMNNYFPACDAILDGEQFRLLPQLLSFVKVARRVVTVSFILSILYNIAGIYFSVRGEMSPLVAAVLMPVSSFSVILITTVSVRIAAARKSLTIVNDTPAS